MAHLYRHQRHHSYEIWVMTHSYLHMSHCIWVTNHLCRHSYGSIWVMTHFKNGVWWRYDWVVTHMDQKIGVSDNSFKFVTYKICVPWLIRIYVWKSHVLHVNVSWCTFEWVMPHLCIGHVTHMNEKCQTHEWVMAHIWMSHVTHMNASCRT